MKIRYTVDFFWGRGQVCVHLNSDILDLVLLDMLLLIGKNVFRQYYWISVILSVCCIKVIYDVKMHVI